MGATIMSEGEIKVVRLTGMLRKTELDAIQWGEGLDSATESRIKVLVIAENFEGWFRGDLWGDVRFVTMHGDQIEKMALVAEPRWQDRFLMFTGAGFRRTQIKFFPADQLAEARAWLAEPALIVFRDEKNAD